MQPIWAGSPVPSNGSSGRDSSRLDLPRRSDPLPPCGVHLVGRAGHPSVARDAGRRSCSFRRFAEGGAVSHWQLLIDLCDTRGVVPSVSGERCAPRMYLIGYAKKLPVGCRLVVPVNARSKWIASL